MEKKNIAELRFTEFSGIWHKKFFGDLYTFKPTNSFSRDMLNYDKGAVKNIHYGDIHTKFNSLFDIKKETVPFVNLDIKLNGIIEDNYVQEGDLIFADASEDYNDIGKCIEIININNENVVSGLHTLLARRKQNNLAKGFASFLMKTYKVRLEIMRIAQGTKVLGISTKRLSEIPIHFPEYEEQKKITAFLSEVEKHITLLNLKKEKLEVYKRGVMQKIFDCEIRFKDDNGNAFPQWVEKSLGEVFAHRSERGNETLELLSVTLHDGIRKQSEMNKRDNSNSDKTNYKLVKEGDIVYNSMRMWQGASGVSRYKGIVSPAYTVLAIKKNNDSTFFSYAFKTPKMIQLFQRNSQGLTSDTWNLKYPQLSEIKMLVPTLLEQLKISAFFSSLDMQIEQAKKQEENMTIWKKGLLQKMFI